MPTREELMQDPSFKAASKEMQDKIVAKYAADEQPEAPVTPETPAAPTSSRGLLGLPKGTGMVATGINTLGDLLIPEVVKAPLEGRVPSGSAVGLAAGLALPGVGKMLPRVAAWVPSGLPLRLTRIILGTVGATVGDVAEGKLPTSGSLAGHAASIGAGEAAGGVIQRIGERLPGASERAGRTMAKDLGRVIGPASPPLAAKPAESFWGQVRQHIQGASKSEGVMTPQALEAIGQGKTSTRQSAGRYMDTRIKEAAQIVGPTQQLHVPALADAEKMAGRSQIPAAALKGYMDAPPDMQAKIRAASPGVFDAPARFTVEEATNALKKLRLEAFGAAEASRLKKGQEPTEVAALKQRYFEAAKQIEQELATFPNGEKAAAAFREGRHAFAVGIGLIDTLKKAGVFSRGPGGVEMNTRGLQLAVAKNRDMLQRVLTPDEWKAMERVVYRGAGIEGGADLRPQTGMLKRAGQLVQRQYVGESPFKPDEISQILIDANVHRLVHPLVPAPMTQQAPPQ